MKSVFGFENTNEIRNTAVIDFFLLISLLIVIVLLLGVLYNKYWKRASWQQQDLLKIKQELYKEQELNEGLQKQYALLKEELKQKDDNILALQNEIIKYKKKRQTPQEKLEALKEQRSIWKQEILECQTIYMKLQAIIDNCKTKGVSKETLTEEEWLKLLAKVDKSDVVTNLSIQYGFVEKEIYLCCLSLMDLSVINKARIMGNTRSTIYRMEQRILEKMGEDYQTCKLEKLLKSTMNT